MENFDIQTIQNMIGQNVMTVTYLSEQMGIISTKMNTHDNEIASVKDRLETLEYRTEISGKQVTKIKDAAAKKLIEILGKEIYDSQRYNRIFYAALYRDSRRYAGLCNPISSTARGDYQRILNYIESWNPAEGVLRLKDKADKNAEIRRANREAGYITYKRA